MTPRTADRSTKVESLSTREPVPLRPVPIREEAPADAGEGRPPFTIIDNWVLEEYGAQIGTTAYSVYSALCKFRNNTSRKCWPSNETIARLLGIKRQTVAVALDKLEAAGLIRRQPMYLRYGPDRKAERVTNEWEPQPDGLPSKRLSRTSDTITILDNPSRTGEGGAENRTGSSTKNGRGGGSKNGRGVGRKSDPNYTNQNQTNGNQTKGTLFPPADAAEREFVQEDGRADDLARAFYAGLGLDPDHYDAATLKKRGRELARLHRDFDTEAVEAFVDWKLTNPWFADRPNMITSSGVLNELPLWVSEGRPEFHPDAGSREHRAWHRAHYDDETIQAGCCDEGELAQFGSWLRNLFPEWAHEEEPPADDPGGAAIEVVGTVAETKPAWVMAFDPNDPRTWG